MKDIKMVIEFSTSNREISHGDIWEDTEVLLRAVRKKVKEMKYDFERGTCEIK